MPSCWSSGWLPPGSSCSWRRAPTRVVPALVVGLGGIWTEVLDDARSSPCPPHRRGSSVRCTACAASSLLLGGRGRPPVDLAAVAAAASKAGDVLLDSGLELLELNPLIAGADGCVAVDALIRWSDRT